MTEIMPVPRNLILLSYQQRAYAHFFLLLKFNKESIFTLMHELSHQLGAPDHYCYGPSTTSEGCANPNCDTCYMGRDAERPCMMTYRYDIEATDEDVLYCSSCLQTIATHLTDHHQ